jgi:hypothetical protein
MSTRRSAVSEFEGFEKEEPIVSETRRRGLTREQAIEEGRQLGENEANRRGEIGEERAGRIERAMAYAAWDFDGRPSGRGQVHDARVPFHPDFKKGKK